MFLRKALPPTYFTISIITMLILHFCIPVQYLLHYPYTLFGILFLIAGAILNLWSDQLFKKHKTTVKPFENSTVLITHGPFRFSRNPMYLGMIFILTGLFLLLGSLSTMLVIPIFIFGIQHNFIIAEENALSKTFGQKFHNYKRQTRRWM